MQLKMRAAVISVEIVVVGTVPKGLKRGLEEMKIEERINTFQTTVLMRWAIVLRRV